MSVLWLFASRLFQHHSTTIVSIFLVLQEAATEAQKMKAPIPNLILLYATLTQSLKVVTKRGSGK